MRTISDLRIGESGTVLAVVRSDVLGSRLLEMGLTPGTEVCLRGVAPLGDPLELEVRGYRLSLRRGEANCVTLAEPPRP